jgi:hypothetical protein
MITTPSMLRRACGQEGWGHSVIDEVLDLGRRAEVGSIALYHHDPERDDGALDCIGADAARWAPAHAPGLLTIVAREGLSIDYGGDADETRRVYRQPRRCSLSERLTWPPGRR